MALVDAGVRKLRAVEAQSATRSSRVELFRGMRDSRVPEAFLADGGSEFAPMSTTYSLAVAMQYASSDESVIFRLRTDNALMRGADLSYLSAFPRERECLFPPLTYLAPERGPDGRPLTQEVVIGNAKFHVVDVKPAM